MSTHYFKFSIHVEKMVYRKNSSMIILRRFWRVRQFCISEAMFLEASAGTSR
jgi:hypothetical protein